MPTTFLGSTPSREGLTLPDDSGAEDLSILRTCFIRVRTGVQISALTGVSVSQVVQQGGQFSGADSLHFGQVGRLRIYKVGIRLKSRR